MALGSPAFLRNLGGSETMYRRFFSQAGGLQPGVFGPNDFKVSQYIGLTSVSVSTGYAAVSSPTGDLYMVPNISTALTAQNGGGIGHATLPRIDSVILKVYDKASNADTYDGVEVLIRQGTATAGATLDNRSGAPIIAATNELRLADMLAPAGSAGYTTANIRDRRPWARGMVFNNTGNFGTSPTTTSTSGVSVGSTVFTTYPRLELNPANAVEVSLSGFVSNNTAGTASFANVSLGTTNVFLNPNLSHPTANGVVPIVQRRVIAAGVLPGTGSSSYVGDITFSVSAGTGTLTNNTNLNLTVREIVSGTDQNGNQ